MRQKFSWNWGWIVVLMLALGAGCTRKADAPAGAPVAVGSRSVNVAIWSNYLVPEVAEEFMRATGIKVVVSNFSANEELLAKIQAGASQYDVIVPSDYMVFTMIKLGLLRPLEYGKLPNARSLDPQFLKKGYDPENKFSVPFDWGTTGIAINRDLYKGQIKGWKDVFDNPELAGKFTMLDDVRETMGAALRTLGYSINSKNPDELKKAQDVLSKVRSKIKAFSSEPMMIMVNGEAAVSHAYVSDALLARKKTAGKVEYIVPSEGCTFWTDNLAVPSSAPHPDAAWAFINYMLAPKSNAATVQAVFVAPANKDVMPLLPPDLQKDPNLFPPAGALARCEMIQDLGDSLEKWDRAWTEVKAKAP